MPPGEGKKKMNKETARAKAHELVSRMTVDEAASQLRFDSPAIERLGIPAYNWWNETLHGVARAGTATVFPQAIGMAASFDTELLESIGRACAIEGRAKYNIASKKDDRDIYKGLTFWSPNVNIFRDPRWGRGQETYGEDPTLTTDLGVAFVKGLQGDSDNMISAACAKHFAVHSGPEALRHEFDAKATEKDLQETYLPAFKALVKEADVEAVMGAYNRTNGEPCCGSKYLLVDTLRKKWGFDGHVVSDCWAVRDFHERHKVTSCPEESVRLALNNGCDVNCGCTYQHVMHAYEKGLISEDTIRTSCERLFATRFRLGLFDGSEFDGIGIDKIECKEHLVLSEKAAAESCVLLKNNGILPIDRSKIKTVGVIGPNANSRMSLIGNYHGTASRYITVLEGIQDELGDEVRVLYSEGCDISKSRVEHLAKDGDRISEAKAVAEASDVVILVVGLNENLEGEEGDEGNNYVSGDKADLLLTKPQRELMEAVLSCGTPVVTVLMAGSSIDLETAGEKTDALLLAWYPGARGGRVVADILFGKTSPSGKLPVTFYRNADLERMPDFTDYSMNGRTYRYIGFEPLYPFGYGLTYGKCRVLSANAGVKDGKLFVSAKLENTGLIDTEDVLEIYADNPGNENAPLNARFIGCRRFFCKAGESIEVKLEVSAERLMVVDENGELVPGGETYIYAGLGQPDKLTEKLYGSKCAEIKL